VLALVAALELGGDLVVLLSDLQILAQVAGAVSVLEWVGALDLD